MLNPVKEWLYGHTENISITGNRLYATFGNVLRAYDITTPSSPNLIKEIPYAGIVVGGGLTTGRLLVSNDKMAAVSQFGEGVVIINNSNYSTKRLTYDKYITSIYVYGNTLYIGNDNKYIVLDVTNPSNPVELSRITASVDGIFTNGTVICCTYGSTLDIRNMNGGLVSSVNFTYDGNAYNDLITGLDFYGSTIIIGTRTGKVHKVNQNGTITGTYNAAYFTGCKIAVYNNYAISAFHDYRVEVLSLTTTNPTLTSTYDYLSKIAGYPRDVRTYGQYFFMAAHMRGVDIVSLSNISSPSEVAKIPSYGRAYACILSNDSKYVFITDDFGLRIIDVSQQTPVEVKYIDNIGRSDTSISIDRTKNWLFGAFSWAGLRIFNISNPSNPTTILNYNPTEYINSVVYYQNRLYLTADTYLKIYEITQNLTLNEIGNYNLGGRVQYIHDVVNNIAYASYDTTIVLLDISNPSNIRLLSSIHANTWISKVKVYNNILYSAIRTDGLLIADVTNPTSPVIKSKTKLVYGIEYAIDTVDGKTLYMGTGGSFVQVDATNLSSPKIVDQSTSNNYREVLYINIYGNYISAAFEGEGIKLYSLTPITQCTSLSVTTNIYT